MSAAQEAMKTPTGTFPEVYRPGYLLVMVYFFFEYVRPQESFPVLGSFKLPLIVSVIGILMWFFRGNRSVFREPLIILYLLFLVQTAASVFYAVNGYWVYKTFNILALVLVAGVLPFVSFMYQQENINRFFRVWLVFHLYIAAMSISAGGTGVGSFLGDENDLALALNMAMPYAYFLALSPHASRKFRLFAVVVVIVLISAVVVTESRGGFIGLMASVFGILMFTRNRIRNFLALIIIGASVYMFLPETYLGEMESIQDDQDLTRKDRLYSWRRGWEMFVDNPILGVGSGNYPWRVEEYELKSIEYDPRLGRLHGGRVAHSLYFTLLPEFGIVGTLIYCLIAWKLIRKLLRISSYQKYIDPRDTRRQELALLSRAMAASMVAFFACGAFISVLFYQHLWYLIGFAIALEYAMMQGTAPGEKATGECSEESDTAVAENITADLVPADKERQES